MQNPEPVRRTPEIEEISNLLLIHPLANRLTPLLRAAHISPNAVSLVGMACGIAAGYAYFHYEDWRWAVAGLLLMLTWHVMDGADGQLARLTSSQSELGRILDGVCDYVTFAAVYISLAIRLSRDHGSYTWWVVAVAGVCHAVQAGAYEAQRQEYEFWGWDRASKNILRPQATDASPRVLGGLGWLYERIQSAAIGATVAFHQQLQRRIDADPIGAGTIRRGYRTFFASSVRQWSLLSANNRTFGIFTCAILHVPMAYFLFEVVGFSIIMAVLAARQRRLFHKFLLLIGMPGAFDQAVMIEPVAGE